MVVTWGEGSHSGNVAAHGTLRLTWNHFVRVFILFGEAILSLRHVCRKDLSGFAGLRGPPLKSSGRGEVTCEARKQCQLEKGSNCEPKRDSQLCPRTGREN